MKEKITIRIKDKYIQRLKARGLKGLALSVKPFSLSPSSFTVNNERLKPKHIAREDQLGWFKKMLEFPFNPWCFCISSDPNDRQAKAVGAYLMQHALKTGHTRQPLWYDVQGNFENPLIGDDFSKPSMLILANVLPNSTAVKFEKLRDILVKHENIPRIVVTAGIDPFSFFAKNLYYPLSGCLYLKTHLVKSEVI